MKGGRLTLGTISVVIHHDGSVLCHKRTGPTFNHAPFPFGTVKGPPWRWASAYDGRPITARTQAELLEVILSDFRRRLRDARNPNLAVPPAPKVAKKAVAKALKRPTKKAAKKATKKAAKPAPKVRSSARSSRS